jgi:hypothetical protein
MGLGGKTEEHLEMVAAKAGNYTPLEDEFDSWIARIECLWSVYFQHYHMILPHCHLRVVVSQTTHRVEPYWFSSAEIISLTSYVNKKMVLNKLSMQLVISNAAEYR